PDDHSANLFIMLSDPEATANSILAASRRAFADVTRAAPAAPHSRAAHARLRVGYVTGETRSTPAYYFFRPFLSHHDRSSIEVFVYSTTPWHDEVTDAYRQWPQRWLDCANLSDAALIETIRADCLDVAIDLSGHFIFNRLGALAERVAPV